MGGGRLELLGAAPCGIARWAAAAHREPPSVGGLAGPADGHRSTRPDATPAPQKPVGGSRDQATASTIRITSLMRKWLDDFFFLSTWTFRALAFSDERAGLLTRRIGDPCALPVGGFDLDESLLRRDRGLLDLANP